MESPITSKLPTLTEVERELSRNAREAWLLRSLRNILKRIRDRERVAEQLRREGVEDE